MPDGEQISWISHSLYYDICSVVSDLQVARVVTKNYPESTNKEFPRPQNKSQPTAEPTTSNLSNTDHFSYYTVADTKYRVLLELNYWIQAFLFKLVPCMLLTVLTVMLIVVMHQANRRRMKLKSQVSWIIVNVYMLYKVDVLHVRLTKFNDLHAAHQNLPFPPNPTLPLKQCLNQGRLW